MSLPHATSADTPPVMIAQVSPPAFASIGWKFYLVFAICGFSNALFFWVSFRKKWRLCILYSHDHSQAFLPETKGIPLEEIDEYFASVPLFVPASKTYVPDADVREEELRHRKFAANKGSEARLEEGSLREKDSKRDLEHVE